MASLKNQLLISAALLGLLCSGTQCGPATNSLEHNDSGQAVELTGEPESPGLPAGLQKEVEVDRRFNDLARFIAGQELDSDSELITLTKNAQYEAYRKRVRTAWSRFEEKHLAAMREWNSKLADRGCGPNVFYPFSGPDITHAVSLFPEAPTYVLFGLETVGPIPSPSAKSGAAETARLNAVMDAVGDVLGRNFFKTIDMAVDVGQNDYSGVAGLLLFFLGNLGYEVLEGLPVYIAEDGSIQAALPSEMPHATKMKVGGEAATGVTYFFRRPGGPIQQVTYFSINLADSAYGENLKNFLRGQRQIVTMLKAASYLMYRPSFDGVRSTILGRSNCILTDSSGVPFHYLNNARWQLDLYGLYRRPVPLFKTRFQPDFFVTLKSKERETLPFSYGYNYGPGLSHLIFAVRDLSHNPWFAPEFDDSTAIGENTVWNAGNRTMVREHQYAADAIALSKDEADETRFERPGLGGGESKTPVKK